jgi:kinesin family protein 6/9
VCQQHFAAMQGNNEEDMSEGALSLEECAAEESVSSPVGGEGEQGKSKRTPNGIQTYLRVRPSKEPSGWFSLPDDKSRLCFHVPLEMRAGDVVNNTRTQYNFKFNGVLPDSTNQEEVFNLVGVDSVRSILAGYNATIFAYGQTGSGKTFSLTGGAERYVDRGLIPRCLSMIFAESRTQTDVQYTFHISYLEIYNEQGYDLLDPSHDTKKMEDLPRVTLLEDEGGNIHLKNLAMYMAPTEEEALNYLFLGDTNRAIAETAMNKASSRSHCIFTISAEGRRTGSDTVTRSKLHLVDLAGSERVHKTLSSGQTLREAKSINSSLFFLEMVIVALHEKRTKGRQHVPYRNSMMTSVLRDSLGGNCKTVMLATINPEKDHTGESISTCQFAQRVSLIQNDAVINEDLDPELAIRRLKAEVAALKAELAFTKGESGAEESLTDTESELLTRRCEEFVADTSTEVPNIGQWTALRLKACFGILRNLVLYARKNSRSSDEHGALPPSSSSSSQEISALRDALQQRDAEIAILVDMVKKSGGEGGRSIPEVPLTAPPPVSSSLAPRATVGGSTQSRKRAPARGDCGVPWPSGKDISILDDAQQAFEYFRGRYSGNESLEENKEVLREKYITAKATGDRVNRARSTINYLKSTIEQIRRERALNTFTECKSADPQEIGQDSKEDDETKELDEEDEEEQKYKLAMDEEKQIYKASFHELRSLKSEIEHIQRLLEKSRSQMQADFSQWYESAIAAGAARKESTPEARSVEKLSIPPNVSLTGNQEADDDILAFYRAKKELQDMQRRQALPAAS